MEELFIGKHIHNLDGKNRLIIPSKYRELLTDPIIAEAFNCLMIYEKSRFQTELNERRQRPDGNILARMMASGADNCNFDRTGRVLIPQFLIELFPELAESREMIIIGAGNHLEIWPLKRWLEYYRNHRQHLEE